MSAPADGDALERTAEGRYGDGDYAGAAAGYEPAPAPERVAALAAMAGDPAALDAFTRVAAGVDAPAALVGEIGMTGP